MIDMTPTIAAKSNQMNSDDLIGGAITIKITAVSVVGNEQPVSISYEGDQGKPFKPCKSMCRVLVTAWGTDGDKYVGQSMTLWRDPQVLWAGKEVGGIRISHMTGIDKQIVMSLTATRGSKKPYVVRPLVITEPVATANDDGFPISDDDYGEWKRKINKTETLEEITVIGQEIGKVSANYDQESTQKLKDLYKGKLTEIKEAA